MNVQEILSRKSGDIVTIEPFATLNDAVRKLADHRIGALVVTGADHRLVGIVSERDIVRVMAEKGCAALDLQVADTMTRKVVTCNGRDTVRDIMERMTAGKFRHLPVVEQGRLAGVISIGDVVKVRLQEMEAEQNALCDYIRTA